jgi:integrase
MPSDLIALVKACRKTRAKHYMPALIYLGAEHGASKQESLSLQWIDIQFEAEGIGLINLCRTKNGSERTEFLMPNTKKALLEWKEHLEFMRRRKKILVKDDRFVFCRLDGTQIKRFNKAWNRTCDIAGICNFHYHDLRHTLCSNLIMSGSDLKEAKDMIGHRDLQMTDRYTHLNALHKKAIQDRLADRYANAKS